MTIRYTKRDLAMTAVRIQFTRAADADKAEAAIRDLPAGTFADEAAQPAPLSQIESQHRAALRGLVRAFSIVMVDPAATDESIGYCGQSLSDMSIVDLECAVMTQAKAQGDAARRLAEGTIAHLRTCHDPDSCHGQARSGDAPAATAGSLRMASRLAVRFVETYEPGVNP